MYKCSPIAHIEKIRAPIMIMVGERDKRVHPSQGLDFARNLTALGKRVEVHKYPDNHSLGKFNVYMNFMMNAAIFMDNNV